MSDLALLKQEIERVRLCLHEMVVVKKENFADCEVSRLSTHLDNLILQYQHLKAGGKQIGR